MFYAKLPTAWKMVIILHPSKEQMIAVVALGIYQYNRSPMQMAVAIDKYFEGGCMDLVDLCNHFVRKEQVTNLPMPTVLAHLEMALDMYGHEAANRIEANLEKHG